MLLSQTALLPAALKADSVEEFLADPEVTGATLRDLCLRMENPALQDIRDACADLFRADDESDEDVKMSGEVVDDVDENPIESYKRTFNFHPPGHLPDKWVSKKDKARKQAADERRAIMGGIIPDIDVIMGGLEGQAVNFGDIQDDTGLERRSRSRSVARLSGIILATVQFREVVGCISALLQKTVACTT